MELEKFKELHARFFGKELPEEVLQSEEYEAYEEAIHEDEACYNWAITDKFSSKGFDYQSYCCLMMADKVYESLDADGEIRYNDPEVVINKWDENLYGIPLHNGSASMVVINYCPWCGTKISN
ncbi:DUF6980 family protein [Pontibacter indicus]|uniref:DUF6980 domain-containing protein n=1 Tax=Pontibacter indicus TaxID=1317125 RepID=A0A1R3XU36_9BACT|nr:hypothetical protein [Pontibacter indicus]SIT94923.1 hypothetical protein SAMN05444128_3812 [Pontibacter indicus]